MSSRPVTVLPADVRELVARGAMEWGAPDDAADRLARQVEEELVLVRDEALDAWPAEPDLPGPPDPDPLPLDTLPSVLRDHVVSVAESVQVDSALPLLLGLASVSAAAAGKVIVTVDHAWDREWVTLYAVAILGPGERKSPAYRHMTDPLRSWEVDQQREVVPRRRAAEDVVEVRERQLKAARQKAADGEPIEVVEQARMDLEDARADVPPLPEILADDSTPEALVRQMAEQGGRVAVMSPEGGPLRVLDGRYSEGAARLEELAHAYDGEAIRSRRISRDTPHVRRPALTLGLTIQPSVLETIRNGRSLRGQGIYGRITWVEPPSLMGERLSSGEVPPLDAAARDRYAAMLHALLDWQAREIEEDGTPVPHRIHPSEDARSTLYAFHDEIESRLAPGGDLRSIADWAGKTVGRAVRIATLLDLAARAADGRPLTDPISGWAMESAVRLCRSLTTHTRAVYGAMGDDGELALLRYVLRRATELPTGSRERDLYEATKGRKAIGSMEDLGPLVDRLVERGCLRLVEDPREGPGRPPSPFVEVHPSLRTGVRSIRQNGSESAVAGGSANSANPDAEGGGDGTEVPDMLEGLGGDE